MLIIMSCKKEFIELVPYSTATTTVLYKTDKDFKDAVVGLYTPLRSVYSNFWQFGDLPGDDLSCRISEGSSLAIERFYVTSDIGLLSSTWRDYYKLIFAANTILSQIETADMTQVQNQNQYIGETKFLRALAYFNLVRIFGDVPMVTKVLSTEEALKTAREPVANIYNTLIIPDLIDADSKLPAKYSAADVGRPTSGAAKSLLGMVYLTLKDFAKAESKLQEVTTMGYKLLPKYTDLFDFTKDEHHTEYIFDIEYISGGLGLGSNFTNQFMDNRGDLLNYYGIKGQGGQSGSPTEEYFTLFEANDIRKGYIHHIVDGLPNGKPMIPIDLTTYTTKYVVPISIAGDSPANWKVIRYANILLMYAESLNENGKTDQAITYLNQIRTRAGVTTYSGLTQSDLREKIYLERRLEFYLEGQRWFDLVRTGRALTVMESQGMKPYMTVFPIPRGQIQIVNDPSILPQNQGYD